MINNNILFSKLIIAGVEIPVGGDDVFVDITFSDMSVTETDLSGNPVFNILPNGAATLVVNCRQNSMAFIKMNELQQSWLVTQGRLPLPGTAFRSNGLEVVTWSRGVFQNQPNFVAGQNSQVVSWTLSIAGIARTTKKGILDLVSSAISPSGIPQ